MGSSYQVASEIDEDGYAHYERRVDAGCPRDAAEEWAAWFCAFTAEYNSPVECVVLLGAATCEVQKFHVEIENIPSYRAVAMP